MKNKILIAILFVSIILAVTGIIVKLNGQKAFGDTLLAAGTITWVIGLILIVYKVLYLKNSRS